MKSVILHPSNTKEFNFLIALLERLNIPFSIREEASEKAPAETGDPIRELFGSWESDESAEELIDQIYSDRMDAPREVDL